MKKENLEQFKKRLIMEALLKSLFIGLSIGSGAGGLLAIIFYSFKIVGFYYIIIAFLVVSIAATITLYFTKYKVGTKEIAKRVDGTGLEERVITSLQYSDSELNMAKLQQEDAKFHLDKTPSKAIKFASFKALITIASIGLLIVVSSSIVLKAAVDNVYTKKHQITFMSENVVIDSQQVIGGNLIVKPADPIRHGYAFIEWREQNTSKAFDFNIKIFENRTLVAIWREKENDEMIIERLIQELRDIINRANVSEQLKADLHVIVDNLEISIKLEDSLYVKISKIEDARTEILRRIREEMVLIGEALMEFDSTYALGEVVLTEVKKDITNKITSIVLELSLISDDNTKVIKMLKTAYDIEAALKLADERNLPLRRELQALANLLIEMAADILQIEIRYIGEALQDYEYTVGLGEAIVLKDSKLLENSMNELLALLLSFDRPEQIIALLQTADDIDEVLAIVPVGDIEDILNSNIDEELKDILRELFDENTKLREILAEFAELLRKLAEEIIEGDIPEDSISESLEEIISDTTSALKDLFGDQEASEEDLTDEIEDAIDGAIDDLLGNEEEEPADPDNPEEPDEGDDPEEGEGEEEDESDEDGEDEGDEEDGENTPPAEDKNPTIIDGETSYLTMLEQLKADAREKLSNPNLSELERMLLNNYINAIDAEIKDIEGE